MPTFAFNPLKFDPFGRGVFQFDVGIFALLSVIGSEPRAFVPIRQVLCSKTTPPT